MPEITRRSFLRKIIFATAVAAVAPSKLLENSGIAAVAVQPLSYWNKPVPCSAGFTIEHLNRLYKMATESYGEPDLIIVHPRYYNVIRRSMRVKSVRIV